MARSEDLKTPLVRFAFTRDLFKPRENETSHVKKYGATLLLPKRGVDLKPLGEAVVKAVTEEWGDKAKGWLEDALFKGTGVIKGPFLDGDGKQGVSKRSGERHAGFAGSVFLRVTSGEDFRPVVVGRKKEQILSVDAFPSGSWGYAVVNAFTWENKENGKGVTFGIKMAQLAKLAEGDDVLGGGGGVDVDKWAETIEDEETPMPDMAGQGAAGLFG